MVEEIKKLNDIGDDGLIEIWLEFAKEIVEKEIKTKNVSLSKQNKSRYIKFLTLHFIECHKQQNAQGIQSERYGDISLTYANKKAPSFDLKSTIYGQMIVEFFGTNNILAKPKKVVPTSSVVSL